MRNLKAVQQSLIGKLPPGFALSKRGGIIDALYKAFAQALAEAEAATAGALAEMSPRRADRLLPDFERVLGADPCGRDQGAKTLDERQALAWQRWIATGGQSIPYFLALAKALGYEVTIEEYWPSIAGVMQAGTPLIPDGEQFVWTVHMRAQNPWHFHAGRNTAGEPLGGWDEGSLECIFRRLKPAHTVLVFQYDLEEPEPETHILPPEVSIALADGGITVSVSELQTDTGKPDTLAGIAWQLLKDGGLYSQRTATDYAFTIPATDPGSYQVEAQIEGQQYGKSDWASSNSAVIEPEPETHILPPEVSIALADGGITVSVSELQTDTGKPDTLAGIAWQLLKDGGLHEQGTATDYTFTIPAAEAGTYQIWALLQGEKYGYSPWAQSNTVMIKPEPPVNDYKPVYPPAGGGWWYFHNGLNVVANTTGLRPTFLTLYNDGINRKEQWFRADNAGDWAVYTGTFNVAPLFPCYFSDNGTGAVGYLDWDKEKQFFVWMQKK